MAANIEIFRSLKRNKLQLVEAYRYSLDHSNTPEETAQHLIDEIGKAAAAEITAAMILCKGEWDARISPASRRWARDTLSCTAAEMSNHYLFYCDEIHPAHFDQIASAIRRMA